jgi:alginate O-acetyltransferase complex protein AlgJ
MEHVNDLARLLPAAQREQFPVQTYMMRPVQGGAGEDALIDDVAADVALLGNSYMQPRYGFSSILSNQLMRPVSLMWDVNQVGPYRMMLRYLASGMFRQQRPRLIVWNIHELDLEYQPDRQDIWGQNAVPPRTFLSEVRRMVGA